MSGDLLTSCSGSSAGPCQRSGHTVVRLASRVRSIFHHQGLIRSAGVPPRRDFRSQVRSNCYATLGLREVIDAGLIVYVFVPGSVDPGVRGVNSALCAQLPPREKTVLSPHALASGFKPLHEYARERTGTRVTSSESYPDRQMSTRW